MSGWNLGGGMFDQKFLRFPPNVSNVAILMDVEGAHGTQPQVRF